jgi:Ser/Thr protein kinase RdoA (MazF antagonist)
MADVAVPWESLPEFSAQSPNFNCLRNIAGGNKVIKLNSNTLVKFGRGTTKGEAATQTEVSKILNPTIIRVPQVYRFYRNDKRNIGYIVMEYIDGQPIDVHNTAHLEALRRAFEHLASFQRDYPGPLHPDEPLGILWEDEIPDDYNTLGGLEDWINGRQEDRVFLQNARCVLCHLDTALENILWLPGGTICLLDWASAGYYPRYFELAAHRKKGRPDNIVEELLASPLEPFSAEEKRHMNCLIQACANAMRFARPRKPNETPADVPRHYLRKQPSLPQLVPDEPSN